MASSDVMPSDVALKEPRAVQIVQALNDHKFELDTDALREILLQDRVKDRLVVVLSVAGAFRRGKSFILDFFLRYLSSVYGEVVIPDGRDWLGPMDAPLEGFSWRGGAERETTGILMWSEVFLTTLPKEGDVAIVLLDTQGTFDSESTVRECATVFALSTMVSSIQVYNISQNLQEDDLQHLQLFTEYGRLVLADSGQKPFQKLQFLIRDWSYPYDAAYGETGGQVILKRRLQISDTQHPELKSIREHIHSCFTDISCFLMPHPGLKVATNPKFNGRLSDIEPDFKDQLKKLAPLLLAPKNLILKQISGHKIKAKELIHYFKCYMDIYSGDQLPEPKSILIATAEANNLAALAAAKEHYNISMEALCGGTKAYLCSTLLEREHERIKTLSLVQFDKTKKMGGEVFSEDFRKKLGEELEESYSRFKDFNESKNLFKFTRTPTVFFSTIVALYILSGFFGIIGFSSFSSLINLFIGTLMASIMFWAYIRYSGEYVACGEIIDKAAEIIWTEFMKPSYAKCVEVVAGQTTRVLMTSNEDTRNGPA